MRYGFKSKLKYFLEIAVSFDAIIVFYLIEILVSINPVITEISIIRNQFIDLLCKKEETILCKSMDWFVYERDFRHERVKHGNRISLHVV